MTFAVPEWIERVTSTNTILLERLAAGDPVPDGAVLAAGEQTAGRGRGRRQWLTHPGLDLACSFVWPAPPEARHLVSLSMAVALGVRDLLATLGVGAARTKWPNDVIVGDGSAGHKICGILPELARSTPGAGPDRVVVGLGLNVGMSRAEAAVIDQPATSVFLETGRAPAARELLPGLLEALAPRLESWQAAGFSGLRADWETHCAGLGSEVTVVDGDRQHTGRLIGFGDDGELLLDEGEGPRPVWNGHLRLHGKRPS